MFNNKCFLRNNNSIYLFLIFIFPIYGVGCKNLISVDPPENSLNGANLYHSDETAIAAVTNIYATISKDNHNNFLSSTYLTNISLYSGLSADELTLYNTGNTLLSPFYTNSLLADVGTYAWIYNYRIIFLTNSAIEGLSNNNNLKPEIQKQLLGEAKFIRAFCYFYLVNLYGKVPLVLSTDPLLNSTLARSNIDIVYSQIIDDLKSAQELLSESFLSGNLTGTTSDRVRPTKWAAAALLSRVYLFNSDYKNSELQADLVISNQSLFRLDSLSEVFLKNSNEAIWQLQIVDYSGANTGDGMTYILPSTGPNTDNYPVVLSHHIYNSFSTGDLRRKYWIDSVVVGSIPFYFSFKYKSGAVATTNAPSEYIMVLRLAEQYLIRAEARCQQNRLVEGLSDLNVVRKRAGLRSLSITSRDDLMSAILQERKVELFSEWGHRWLDLKRTNMANVVMPVITAEKGGVWKSDWQLYPISTAELQTNQHLSQNEGY